MDSLRSDEYVDPRCALNPLRRGLIRQASEGIDQRGLPVIERISISCTQYGQSIRGVLNCSWTYSRHPVEVALWATRYSDGARMDRTSSGSGKLLAIVVRWFRVQNLERANDSGDRSHFLGRRLQEH